MALITVDDIGLCRSGPENDIDLQAVYGGRFSGKREKDLKVNPVYSDVNSVNQFSDINGNMSPVHVVTYESYPRTRKKSFPPNHGKYQNGNVIQSLGVSWTKNENNNVMHSELEKIENNIDKDAKDVNHVSELEGKNLKLNEEKHDISKLDHLQRKNSKTISSGLLSNQNDNRAKTNEKHHEDDDVYATSNKLLQAKGHGRDYCLLGYNNESFVLDETKIVIETKQVDNSVQNHTPSKEIHNQAGPKDFEETKARAEEKHVNPKTGSEETTEVNDTREHFQSEISINSELPESTYQEIADVCDFNKSASEDISNSCDLSVNANEDLSNLCESPQVCHKEIVTEVLVHNSAVLETPTMHSRSKYSESDNSCHSIDLDKSQIQMSTDSSDWPDIDALVRQSEDQTIDQSESETEHQGHIRSVSDIVILEKEVPIDTDKVVDQTDNSNQDGSSLYKKKQKKSKSSSKAGVVSEAGSSTRTLKSILSNGSSHYSCSSECEHKQQNSDSEIQELKTVKFSEDTVFNENKNNKYKKERFSHINLRELYRGKIMSDSAVAKMNPLYQPEENVIDGEGESETDNNKLTYQLTLKNALRLSKEKPTSLNSPSYLEQYLILKAHGIKKDNIDIEKLPETMEKPVYDRLIQRTLAKERRKFCVKWSMVIITVAVITAVATTLGVYFKEGF